MSEYAIQQGIQDTLQAMTEFADASVVINDWSILDGPMTGAPYVIITDANNFTARQDTRTPNTKWEIVITLFEQFTDWPTTLNNLRARRQAIIDAFNASGTARSAGLTAVTIDEIRAGSDITEWYDHYIPQGQLPESSPVCLSQVMILTAEEF